MAVHVFEEDLQTFRDYSPKRISSEQYSCFEIGQKLDWVINRVIPITYGVQN